MILERNGSSDTFRNSVEDAIVAEVRLFLSEVPYAAHLSDATEELNERYYIRHRIETVKRIRLTARIDTLALLKLLDQDYDAARDWARYACEELCHDILYLSDLQSHGVEVATVEATPLFSSTERLIQYLDRAITEHGPLAAIAYSLFVEWNSDQFSSRVVQKAEAQFGSHRVAGSKSHLNIDRHQGHYTVILSLAQRIVAEDDNVGELRTYIADIGTLFRDYFGELYDETVLLTP